MSTEPEKVVNHEEKAVHPPERDTDRTWVKDGKLPFYRAGKGIILKSPNRYVGTKERLRTAIYKIPNILIK
jgi:hypothetical protein